jgi:hypothetical protein
MPLTPAQIQAARTIQHAAAQDQSQQVRVVAGPGTGKSSAIEERIRWLIAQEIVPHSIYVVSFTSYVQIWCMTIRQAAHLLVSKLFCVVSIPSVNRTPVMSFAK